MKVVHNIQHAQFKITIFKSGFRFIVKFDTSEFDHSYKFLDGEVASLHELIGLVEDCLIPRAAKHFADLRISKVALLRKANEQREGHNPIEII